MKRKIKCPNCQKETEYSSENKYRPFCSERCRIIDLGEWASGSYRIAQQDRSDDLEENLLEIEQNSSDQDENLQ